MLLLFAVFLLWAPDRSTAELEKTYVRDSGPPNAPAVLLLHGCGSSLHTWEAWAADFSTDMRVITLDLPGSGLSSPDPTSDYSDARSMAIILAVLDQLDVSQVALVGAYADPAVLTPELMQRYHDLMQAPGSRDGLFARMQQTLLGDLVPLLRTIKAPTLLVLVTCPGEKLSGRSAPLVKAFLREQPTR